MKRPGYSVVAGLAGLALALAACSQSGSGSGTTQAASGGQATVKFLAPEYSPATAPYWKDLIARFQKDNPDITIQLETIAWTDLVTKVNTLVAADTPPDILNIDSFVSFAADNLLMPVDEALPKEVVDDLNPKMKENATYEGKAYGIPFIASARALFYNKAILKDAGVQPPKTWAELTTAAKTIKSKTGKIGYGMPMGAPEPMGEFSIWAWNNGGDWRKGDAWTINSPENVAALQVQVDLYKAGVTQNSPWTTHRDDLFKQFGEGKVGILEGAAFLPAVLKQQKSKVDYGVAPSPTATPGGQQATLAVEDYLLVFNKTKSPEAAKKFLAYFYQADNYTKFLKTEGMLPVTRSGGEAMRSDPVAGPFIDMLDNAKFYPTTVPAWPTVAVETTKKLGVAIKGDATPKKVLDDLQKFAESQ